MNKKDLNKIIDAIKKEKENTLLNNIKIKKPHKINYDHVIEFLQSLKK